MKTINIKTISKEITLNITSLDNSTIQAIDNALPVESKAQTWGDEIYFNTGIKAPSEELTTDVAVGDVAYWPQGRCLCIFFGRTPMSNSDKPVPASGVVIVGKVDNIYIEILLKVKDGDKIIVD
jgi:hypothetical protein